MKTGDILNLLLAFLALGLPIACFYVVLQRMARRKVPGWEDDRDGTQIMDVDQRTK